MAKLEPILKEETIPHGMSIIENESLYVDLEDKRTGYLLNESLT